MCVKSESSNSNFFKDQFQSLIQEKPTNALKLASRCPDNRQSRLQCGDEMFHSGQQKQRQGRVDPLQGLTIQIRSETDRIYKLGEQGLGSPAKCEGKKGDTKKKGSKEYKVKLVELRAESRFKLRVRISLFGRPSIYPAGLPGWQSNSRFQGGLTASLTSWTVYYCTIICFHTS